MADKLTAQQRLAVEDRGGNLLVSAAAGSGKTKVLVDRLMGYVLDAEDPADLDDFLIITYTKAAASELRGKIAAKLSEHMATMPENRHLQQQMQRLYLASISTVHSFCGDILRQYAYMLDIAPDFRVGDENECAQLRENAMEKMLEQAYENAQDDPDFRAFTDGQGLGRDDRLVPEILMRLYDSSRCHLDPNGWLEKCLENISCTDSEDAGQTPWGIYLMEELRWYLDLQIDTMERCAVLASHSENMEKPAALLVDTVAQLRHLRESQTWDQVLARRNVDFGRLQFSKKCTDAELAERIKTARQACKKGLEKKLKNFTDPSSAVLADLSATAGAVRGMIQLVKRFEKEYDRLKRSRRILDFSDLEQRTLDLLLGKRRQAPTAAAREIGMRYRQIMVDEYQDSNGVQDAIFEALSGKRGNAFTVGDVKQSIYQFRLADPTIFLDKYERYAPAETASPGLDRKVLLSANFRSGGAVLSSVNDIFRLCMSKEVGGLDYGDGEALTEGIPHVPLGEEEVELWCVDVQEHTYPEEAAFTARRICQLLDGSHFVRDGEALRPIRPEDICILLRSPGSMGKYYMDALATQGIRCTSGGGDDLLMTQEIAVLRSILQTVSNPRQDIPLIAALASPVFGFTADELAQIRSGRKYGCVYDALVESDMEKARDFLLILSQLRRQARLEPLPVLVQTVLRLTRLDSIYGAMADGGNRVRNIQSFCQLCAGMENYDLEQFLEHLDTLEDKGLICAGQDTSAGAVTLMSIHKSKGLEFPVVFVCGLSRQFNRESARAQVLCDQKMGIGLSAVDRQLRLRYPTIAKRAIGSKILSDGTSEELRVLYVALTRARDRLIMVYASDALEKELKELSARMALSDPRLISLDASCMGQWVLMAAMRRTEAGALHRLGGCTLDTVTSDARWRIGVTKAQTEAGLQTGEECAALPDHVDTEHLRRNLAFRYPYEAATAAPSKQTATQRKGRVKDQEAAQDAAEAKTPERRWRRASFVQVQADGALRGNAMHAAMQYMDLTVCSDEASVDGELRRLTALGFLKPEQAELVDRRQILRFFDTDLGKKCRNGKLLREFKFSILDPGEHLDAALAGEQILLQGVVDCALLETDGITVIDFKTDAVTKETVNERAEHYRAQVLAYAAAMERICKMPVKAAVLYFFCIGVFIEVKP